MTQNPPATKPASYRKQAVRLVVQQAIEDIGLLLEIEQASAPNTPIQPESQEQQRIAILSIRDCVRALEHLIEEP